MTNLYEFVGKEVKIKDIKGNIIKAYVFDYDDGSEEDEDSTLFNVPYLWLENIKIVVGSGYISKAILSKNEIVSIEEI